MRKLALDKQAMNRLSAYLRKVGQDNMNEGGDPLPNKNIQSAMSAEIDRLVVRIQAVLDQFQYHASKMGPTGSEVIYILQDVVTNLTDTKQRMIDDINNQMSNTLSPASGSY
jgi:hypothetical protein